MLHRPRPDTVEHELDRLLYEITQHPSYCQLELRALLRQFRDDAYETGYNEGHNEGYEAGRGHSDEINYQEGYNAGYMEGKLYRDDQ